MATIADVVPGSSVRHGFRDPAYRAALGVEHLGADLAAPIGTPVRSPVSGRVSFAGQDDASGEGGLGAKVQADDGASVGVWHLSRVDVAAGQRVAPGQQLGLAGQSGGAVYPHTHLQVEQPPGTPVDPLGYLAGLGGGGIGGPIVGGSIVGGAVVALLVAAALLED